MFRLIQIGLGVVALVALSTTVRAAVMTNVTQSTAIFDDNFETEAVDVVPPLFPDHSAPIGTWAVWSSSSGSGNVIVRNAASGGYPAYKGDNYLQAYRDAGASPGPYAFGKNDGAGVSTAGDTITLNLAFRVDGANDDGAGLQAIFEGQSGTQNEDHAIFEIGLHTDGTLHDLGNNGGSDRLLTQTYVHGAWNLLSITGVNGAGVWQLSVNGHASEDLLHIVGMGGQNWDGFSFGGCWSSGLGGTTMAVDGLVAPEPASVTLLSAALLGLVAYAWRKRT